MSWRESPRQHLDRATICVGYVRKTNRQIAVGRNRTQAWWGESHRSRRHEFFGRQSKKLASERRIRLELIMRASIPMCLGSTIMMSRGLSKGKYQWRASRDMCPYVPGS